MFTVLSPANVADFSVDQVHAQEQVPVTEDLARAALRDDAVPLREHDAAIRHHVEPLEVVGRQHNGLAGFVEGDDELEQPLQGALVGGGGGGRLRRSEWGVYTP